LKFGDGFIAADGGLLEVIKVDLQVTGVAGWLSRFKVDISWAMWAIYDLKLCFRY
jgi:hypothetical protein